MQINKNQKIFLLTVTAVMFLTIFPALPVAAQQTTGPVDAILGNLSAIGGAYGQPQANSSQNLKGALILRIGGIVRAFLGLLGLVMVILILYGGYLWLTARGNEDRVDEAKHTIQSAIIGAIIIIGSWAITAWVISHVVAAWDPLESTCRHASLSIL